MGFKILRAHVAIAAALACGATGAAPTIELASRGAFLAPVPANGFSGDAAMSADGRYVAFVSQATNLGAPDTNGFNDIYLADRVAGTFTLVSRSAATAADGTSASAAISADGTRIAFVSDASNLVAGDANGLADAFVLDRGTGTFRRLLPPGGAEPASGATAVQISADGRYVAIETAAANWVPSGDTNNVADVYVYDLVANTVERATVGNAGEQPANLGFDADRYSLAGNGRCVAFATQTALEATDTNNLPDVYLRNLDTDVTVRVSVSAAGVSGNNESGSPWTSPDCSRVAFLSAASNLEGVAPNFQSAVFEKTLLGGAIARIWPPVADPPTTTVAQRVVGSRNGAYLAVSTTTPANGFVDGPIVTWRRADGVLVTSPATVQGFADGIQDDGAIVVYSTARPVLSTDRNANSDLALFDTAGLARIPLTVPASIVTAASGNGSSGIGDGFSPLLRGQFRQQFASDDGLLVAYSSIATNLVAADDNGFEDVFVLDRRTGLNQRVSRGLGGAEPNGDSSVTDMSADGRWLVVESCATNLVAGDSNGICDLFVVDRTATPLVFERVNVDSGEVQANIETTLAANGGHFGSISADARYVVFASTATNLVPGDTNNRPDIFLRDRVAGTTVLVSRNTTGGFPNNTSTQPRISADGRFATFRSTASNLGGPPGQLWIVDTTTFAHEMASVTSDEVPMGASNRSFVSADGRYVAFVGFDGTVPGDADGQNDVFVRDRMLGKTTIASLKPDGTDWTVQTFVGGLSSRGLILPFIVDEGRSTGGSAYAYDISTGRVEQIYAAPAGFSQSLRPAASANGRHLAVAHNGVLTAADQNGAIWDIYYATNFTTGISGGAEGAAPELALAGASVTDAEMGESVAISDRYIVAGAPGANEVYVYERPAGGTGTTMRGLANAKSAKDFDLVATLPAPGGGGIGDKWGAAVAISPDGNVIAIGAPGVGAGQVAVFSRPAGGWDGSVGAPQLLNAQITGDVTPDDFGTSLDIAEDGRLVVGAPMSDVFGSSDAGLVQVFTPQAGNTYTKTQDLVAPTTQVGAGFGMDVAINANAIAVGSPLEDDGANIDEGTVYTYASAGTNEQFTASATIDPPNGGAFGDKWGMGVGLGDNSLAIGSPGMDTAAGADSGAAYVYQSPSNTFGTAPASELAPPRDAAGEAIGTSVEVAGDYVVIGAPLADRLNVADTGTAFVFERPELGWQTRQRFLADIELRASESQADQEFGDAVSVTRQGLVVGVPRRDVGAVEDQGEADTFVFDRIIRAGFE